LVAYSLHTTVLFDHDGREKPENYSSRKDKPKAQDALCTNG